MNQELLIHLYNRCLTQGVDESRAANASACDIYFNHAPISAPPSGISDGRWKAMVNRCLRFLEGKDGV